MDYQKLADLLYKNIHTTPEYYFEKFPERKLAPGAEVTRTAPSPTGFYHTGGLFGATIDKMMADKTNGVFFLRIEDTDQKRQIAGAADIAYNALCKYNLKPDEGFMGEETAQKGEYGSYIQSERTEIYHTFAKRLVELGRAFPCFCGANESKEEVKQRREEQLEENDNLTLQDPCRNLDFAEIELNIKMGKPWALRLLSQGDPDKIFKFTDLIKGEREIHENAKDIVLVKSNGIPVYALAHVVDDTLMHVTTVVRGEEWWPSLNSHLEIFRALGIKPPKYAHHPVVCKLDEATGNKRKLSKRLDPEADSRYIVAEGYPTDAVNEYLLNLLNSDFENWRKANPDAHWNEFPFSIKKIISSSNPIFDLVKINDIAKNIISKKPATILTRELVDWANEYDENFAKVLLLNQDKVENFFKIDRENDRPRKDIGHYSEVKTYFGYLFDEYFDKNSTLEFDSKFHSSDIKSFLSSYEKTFFLGDDKQTWFDKLKVCAGNSGFVDMKTYKANPTAYIGNVADASNIVRIALTGKTTTPDLYEIMKLLGDEKIKERFEYVINSLN